MSSSQICRAAGPSFERHKNFQIVRRRRRRRLEIEETTPALGNNNNNKLWNVSCRPCVFENNQKSRREGVKTIFVYLLEANARQVSQFTVKPIFLGLFGTSRKGLGRHYSFPKNIEDSTRTSATQTPVQVQDKPTISGFPDERQEEEQQKKINRNNYTYNNGAPI